MDSSCFLRMLYSILCTVDVSSRRLKTAGVVKCETSKLNSQWNKTRILHKQSVCIKNTHSRECPNIFLMKVLIVMLDKTMYSDSQRSP